MVNKALLLANRACACWGDPPAADIELPAYRLTSPARVPSMPDERRTGATRSPGNCAHELVNSTRYAD